MKKSSKSKSTDPFLTLLGEDVYYQLLADAPDRPDPADMEHFAMNPLLDMDSFLCYWEHGLMTLPEFLESVGDVTSSGLETIARGGRNTSWKHFEMFDGQFRSREDSVIGAILRQMHAQADMKLWAPFLQAIDTAVANGQLPAINGRQTEV
ncbi:MAG: hypothetical protein EPN64_09950 [Burkholderiaceae bacterium]|nr:MAG: hypothetical protein EPN64_09950 [Burkholderiaceae bacterium]